MGHYLDSVDEVNEVATAVVESRERVKGSIEQRIGYLESIYAKIGRDLDALRADLDRLAALNYWPTKRDS